MKEKHEIKWKPIQIPKELSEQLEIFADSNFANHLGFTNKSQIAAFAIRDFLRNYSNYMAYMDFLDVNKESVKIMDHKLGRAIEIKIDKQHSELFCGEHNSNYCDHVNFIAELPRFKEELYKFLKPKIPKIKQYTEEEMLEELKNHTNRFLKYHKIKSITNKKLLKIINELQ